VTDSLAVNLEFDRAFLGEPFNVGDHVRRFARHVLSSTYTTTP
jgi:hypothetical protein